MALSDALGLLADADALRTAEVLVNKRLALIQELQVGKGYAYCFLEG